MEQLSERLEQLALDAFMNELQQIEFTFVDPVQLTRTLGEQQKVDSSVIQEALRRLSHANRNVTEAIRTATSDQVEA